MKYNRSFWLVFAAAACVLIIPLFAIDVPPIVDYPNHLARLYIIVTALLRDAHLDPAARDQLHVRLTSLRTGDTRQWTTF